MDPSPELRKSFGRTVRSGWGEMTNRDLTTGCPRVESLVFLSSLRNEQG